MLLSTHESIVDLGGAVEVRPSCFWAVVALLQIKTVGGWSALVSCVCELMLRVVSYVVSSQSCVWIWLWAYYQPTTPEANGGRWHIFKYSCHMFLLKFSPEIWQPLHYQGQSCSRQSSVCAWRLSFSYVLCTSVDQVWQTLPTRTQYLLWRYVQHSVAPKLWTEPLYWDRRASNQGPSKTFNVLSSWSFADDAI